MPVSSCRITDTEPQLITDPKRCTAIPVFHPSRTYAYHGMRARPAAAIEAAQIASSRRLSRRVAQIACDAGTNKVKATVKAPVTVRRL